MKTTATNAATNRPGDSLTELLTLRQICVELARPNGKPLHPSTVYRWATVGLSGCRLQVVVLGRGMRTTRAWIREFGESVARSRGLSTSAQEAN